MKNDNDIYENIYLKYEVQRRVFLEYLQVMIAREDWHGVADLAMDMRELEAKKPNRQKS
jgi:hypothetical protein